MLIAVKTDFDSESIKTELPGCFIAAKVKIDNTESVKNSHLQILQSNKNRYTYENFDKIRKILKGKARAT